MKNKSAAYISVIIILVFILYIIYDTSTPDREIKQAKKSYENSLVEDKWQISDSIYSIFGPLKAVSVSINGDILLGGNSFVACYSQDLKPLWDVNTPHPVTSLSISGDTILASTQETIILINPVGKIINEWGPYDDSCIITSVASNKAFIAFADAGNKLVFIVKKTGELHTIIGHTGKQFIIPSPYFDVALTADNKLIVANTGERRVETRSFEGDLISYFGEPGLSPQTFCGCCNPAHFALLSDGMITAEKGINRIKIVNKNGDFIEFVSSRNNFSPSIPLDVAAFKENTIYAANPADSKLYKFTRK
jgi:hypothetical protein